MPVNEPVTELHPQFSMEGATPTGWPEAREHLVEATGGNALEEGLDLVVEGDAARVSDDAQLHRIADAYESKYGRDWRFEVRDGAFFQEGIEDGAIVFEVAPSTAFGFRKGEYSQTRWRFSAAD
ncbi:MAG: hypothetical protein ACRDZV_04315 [Acidimicrobiia bacterium]